MNILVINSCVRGKEASRSYKIGTEFMLELQKTDKSVVLEELDLMECNPAYLTYSNFSRREQLIADNHLDAPEFALAKQFARADRIVVIAPFWENSFPAILRAYIETVSVCGIAFRYDEEGSVGLCNAKKMMLITTRGGLATGEHQWMDMGSTYLASMCKIYGIDAFQFIAAEGLDLFGVDVEARVTNASAEARHQARLFVNG